MPAVIAAESYPVPASGSSTDPDRHRHRLAPAPRVSDHFGPRVDRTKTLGKLDLFGRVQGGQYSVVDRRMCRGINVIVAISEHTCAYAHQAHVDILSAV